MRKLLLIAGLILFHCGPCFAVYRPGPNEVILFDLTDFAGYSKSYRLEPGMRHRLLPSLGAWEDRISSLMVGDNVSVAMFQHADFMGKYKVSGTDLKRIGTVGNTDLDDKISSLIVFPKRPWGQKLPDGVLLKAYHPRWYLKGRRAFFPLPERATEHEARYPYVGDRLNDLSQAATADGPVDVLLFELPFFGGNLLKLSPKHSPYELSRYRFDRRVSSLIVRSRGWKGEGPVIPKVITSQPAAGKGGVKAHREEPAVSRPSGPRHSPPPSHRTGTPRFEKAFKIDRPGMDYRHFALDTPNPDSCQKACADDKQCKAYTYMRPGIVGARAHCWLKSGVPKAKPVSWYCVSGTKSASEPLAAGVMKRSPPPRQRPASKSPQIHPRRARFVREFKTNRPGMDYRHFALDTPDPDSCQKACADDKQCKAYTYMRPGIVGARAHCWLKSGAPKPRSVSWFCVSGIKVAD
jgi:hypothetical protein